MIGALEAAVQEIIGAGIGGALTLLIVAIVATRGKLSKVPRRVERLEAAVPEILESDVAILDVLLVIMRCQAGHECDGALEEAQEKATKTRDRMIGFLSGQAVSRSGGPAKP